MSDSSSRFDETNEGDTRLEYKMEDELNTQSIER